MKRNHVLILLFVAATSCSQNFSLTEKTITQYQNYDLNTFIKERLIERAGVEGSLLKFNIFLDKTLPKTQTNLQNTEDLENFRKKTLSIRLTTPQILTIFQCPKETLSYFAKLKVGSFC